MLLAAEAAGAGRVVYFSSMQVFGLAEGERLPDYFPVDDAHPRRAMRPYGLSKCLAEDLCAAFTARTGIAGVALRPAWIWDPAMYERIEAQWQADPAQNGRRPGSMASSSMSAMSPMPCSGHLKCPCQGITGMLCAADIAATEPSLVMAARFPPSVPVRGLSRFNRDPWHIVRFFRRGTRPRLASSTGDGRGADRISLAEPVAWP